MEKTIRNMASFNFIHFFSAVPVSFAYTEDVVKNMEKNDDESDYRCKTPALFTE